MRKATSPALLRKNHPSPEPKQIPPPPAVIPRVRRSRSRNLLKIPILSAANSKSYIRLGRKAPAQDNLDRLTLAEYSINESNEVFTIDDLGNRDSVILRDDSNVDYVIDANTNRYDSVGGNSLAYNQAGDLTIDKDDYKYEYDYENRITKIKKPGPSTVAEFAYDALGRRIKKTDSIVANQSTVYYYNDKWQVLCEYGGRNWATMLQWFAYGNYMDETLIKGKQNDETPQSVYLHLYVQDHLFSPVALVQRYQLNLLERYEYDAYGNCQILSPTYQARATSSYNNPYFFTGRTLDTLDNGNLKIQDNRNRYYEYYTGRWLTHDPLGITPNPQWPNTFTPIGQYKDGMNLYEYVQSNPVNRLDPSGLWMGWHHEDLTKKAFKAWVSGLPSKSRPSSKCETKMIKTLQTANVKQDNPFMPTVYEQHYTRRYMSPETIADKVTADKDYETYLKSEATRFNTNLGLLTGCWEALEALGRMDHALEDFYGHAIMRTGGFDPFKAWSSGTTGTPYRRSSFWPASYPGEHRKREEPIDPGSEEGVGRKKAALSFMIGHYNEYLGKWWERCDCVCCR